jgi:hypothetical protein
MVTSPRLTYNYDKIDGTHIRLVHIQPCTDNAILRCTIQTVPIATPPPYEALSYCWGTGPQTEELLCKQESIGINPQLSMALKRLRHANTPRTLWIDQICINQSDNDEKSSQVNLMRTIYSEADRVLVWLGEEDTETELAFRIIDDVNHQTMRNWQIRSAEEGNPSLKLTPPNSTEWVAYCNLLNRPWFTRLWTYQELVLAKTAAVVCGGHESTWNSFASAYASIAVFSFTLPGDQSYLANDTRIIAQLDFGRRLIERKAHSPKDPWDEKISVSHELFSLVKNLRKNKATDPRDKVFALLGVANDLDCSAPEVDYNSHFRVVYSKYSKWFIQRYQDLSVLKLVSVKPAVVGQTRLTCETLPSWVPDLRSYNTVNNLRFEGGPQYLLHGAHRQYNATGSSKVHVQDEQVLHLTLKSLYVGKISIICDPSGNLTGNIAIGANVLSGGQWPEVAASHCSVDGLYEPTSEPIGLAYERLRIVDSLPSETSPADRRKRQKPLTSLPEPGPISYSSEGDALLRALAGDIAISIVQSTAHQRLYITSTGYMGLCHHSCVEGDEVYLLMGGDMPFVLRRLETGSFYFKGETYVHSIMDGEFLLKHYKACDRVSGALGDVEWLDALGNGPLPFQVTTVTLAYFHKELQ